MSVNCLNKELKGAIAGTLPELDRLVMITGPNWFNICTYIQSATLSVTIGDTTTPSVTKMDFSPTAGSKVTIENCYDVYSLALSNFTEGQVIGLDSMLQFGKLAALQVYHPLDISMATGMKFLNCKKGVVNDMASFAEANPDLEFFSIELPSFNPSLFTKLKKVDNIQGYSIEDMPSTILSMNVGYASITGNLENLVTKMRAAGVTSGTVLLELAKNATGITYNGGTLAAYMASNFPGENHIYMTWDANTISFQTTAPSGFTVPNYVSYYPF